MILYEILSKRRKELGLTQKYISSKCNITQAFYAQIETGKAVPSIRNLYSILKVLELKIKDVLKGPK